MVPNLLNIDFKASRPDEREVGHYLHINEQRMVLLSNDSDLYSRKVVGWAIEERNTKS
jgi:hypothetical protein